MSDIDSGSSHPPKDRPEPRGRKPNDHLPPSRAREVQRAFRLRRAEHLAALEERINYLEAENAQLRALLALPEAERPKIGSGPTGRGKSLREGGVPMTERVRARKEARARDRKAKGLPEMDETDSEEERLRTATLSPRAAGTGSGLNLPPLFGQPPQDQSAPFNYQLPMPFNLPVSPAAQFGDFGNNIDTSGLFKSPSGSTPNFSIFNMFGPPDESSEANQTRQSPISPPNSNQHLHQHSHSDQNQNQSQNHRPNNPGNTGTQPDLLTRLKSCCHLSDSHVVNDPGLLIFATRLCQSFPCGFNGLHPDITTAEHDTDHMYLEDSWRALKAQLDPGGEADGENRINTGRMAAELVIRAAHSRGAGGWIVCRYGEGMSVKRGLILGLVNGLGGKMD